MSQRTYLLIALAIELFVLWPSVTLFNRVHPFILGLPPFVFFSLTVFVIVPLFLFIAFKTQRGDEE